MVLRASEDLVGGGLLVEVRSSGEVRVNLSLVCFFSRGFFSVLSLVVSLGEGNCVDDGGFFQKELNPLKVDLEEVWGMGAAALISP